MAAPVWVSSTTVAGGTAASCVYTLPSSIAANDIVVLQLYKENTAAVTPPAGFTEKTAVATTVNVHSQHILWKRMTGGESGTITASWTGSVWRAGHAHRITGVITSGDPWDAINTAIDDGAVLVTPAVSLTGTPTNSLLFWGATDFSGATVSITEPSGFTEQAFDPTLWSATKDNTAGGNTGSLTATASNGSGQMTAFVGTLAEATGGVSYTVMRPASVAP